MAVQKAANLVVQWVVQMAGWRAGWWAVKMVERTDAQWGEMLAGQ